MGYLTGYMLAEQSATSPDFFDPATMSELQRRFPRVFSSLADPDEDTFKAGIGAILDGFARPSSTKHCRTRVDRLPLEVL